MKKLLIVVDMQNDFVTGVLGSPAAAAAVPHIRERIESCRAAGDTVLFTMDTHTEVDYIPAQTREAAVIPAHCLRGTAGWQIVPELLPYAEKIIEKPAFLSLTLAEEIRALCKDPTAIELCGVCTDICVVSNALALRGAFPASPITVSSHCCAGTSDEKHEAALAVMESCLIGVERS